MVWRELPAPASVESLDRGIGCGNPWLWRNPSAIPLQLEGEVENNNEVRRERRLSRP